MRAKRLTGKLPPNAGRGQNNALPFYPPKARAKGVPKGRGKRRPSLKKFGYIKRAHNPLPPLPKLDRSLPSPKGGKRVAKKRPYPKKKGAYFPKRQPNRKLPARKKMPARAPKRTLPKRMQPPKRTPLPLTSAKKTTQQPRKRPLPKNVPLPRKVPPSKYPAYKQAPPRLRPPAPKKVPRTPNSNDPGQDILDMMDDFLAEEGIAAVDDGSTDMNAWTPQEIESESKPDKPAVKEEDAVLAELDNLAVDTDFDFEIEDPELPDEPSVPDTTNDTPTYGETSTDTPTYGGADSAYEEIDYMADAADNTPKNEEVDAVKAAPKPVEKEVDKHSSVYNWNFDAFANTSDAIEMYGNEEKLEEDDSFEYNEVLDTEATEFQQPENTTHTVDLTWGEKGNARDPSQDIFETDEFAKMENMLADLAAGLTDF